MKKDVLDEIDLSKFAKNMDLKPLKPGQIGEIKISGFTVEVFNKSRVTMNGRMGAVHRTGRGKIEIWLQYGLSGRLREFTILHELVHLVTFVAIGSMNEDKTRAFGAVLFGVLKDNFNINLNRLKNKR